MIYDNMLLSEGHFMERCPEWCKLFVGKKNLGLKLKRC